MPSSRLLSTLSSFIIFSAIAHTSRAFVSLASREQRPARPAISVSTLALRLYPDPPSVEVAADSEMFDDDDFVPSLPPISPTSKRLFLVRHGEVINPGGDRPVYYGAMDVSLSPLGEQEARAAAEYLKRYDLQHIAASPLGRAKFGANEILKLQSGDDGVEANRDLVIYDGFKELDRGDWCGMTLDEIGKKKYVEIRQMR
mmetsp:Transcript_5858/g.11090  ORF Transcript_5858/g.11090 Transcript_5858/m.11090 type:complete len:200 (+) Transcript_5858:73-672(+)